MSKKKRNLFLSTIILRLSKKETMFYVQYQKEIQLQNLNYWNVDLQEAYFSPWKLTKDTIQKKNNLFPSIVGPNPLRRISNYHFSKILFSSFVNSVLFFKIFRMKLF